MPRKNVNTEESMHGPRPQEVLRRELDIINAAHARQLAGLEDYLTTPGGKETLGLVGRFRATLAHSRSAGNEGQYLFRAGAEAFVGLLAEHPSFGAARAISVGLPVFGKEEPGEDGFRRDAAELITLGAMAIATMKGAQPQYFDTLFKVAVGADDFAGLLRNVFLGHQPGPDYGPDYRGGLIPQVPQKLLDLMSEIERRTCGLAISHALSSWGQAVGAAKSRAWSTGITSINPAVGCTGDEVTITGSGFGTTQPVGVNLAFAGREGGCVFATVVSWSDTQIVAIAPPDVGAGCIGFVQPGNSGELVTAADSLAGEMERCIGLPAFNAVESIRTYGSRVIPVCPPCLPMNDNYFQGGQPYIEYFSANGSDVVQIAPAAALTLNWSVRNAASIEIVETPAPLGQPDELPSVTGPLNAANGSYAFPSVAGTFT